MKRFISISAAIAATALAVASAGAAQVTSLPLPAPPAASNAASSTIFDALLAIARTAASNPAAAQQATFSYTAAIQQYNAGDLARARSSALTAIVQTAAVPLPAPSLMAPPIPQQHYVSMPVVTSTDQADAEGYVALARKALTLCGTPEAPIADAIMQQYTAAVNALIAKHNDAAKSASQSVIDQCATGAQAYAKQLQAMPAPSDTPLAMASYVPVPIATLGPDPALAATPSPAVMPSTSPAPETHRRFKL